MTVGYAKARAADPITAQREIERLQATLTVALRFLPVAALDRFYAERERLVAEELRKRPGDVGASRGMTEDR